MALTFWGKTFSPVCDAMPSSDAMPRLDAPEVSAGGGCQFPPLMMGRGGRTFGHLLVSFRSES